MASIVARLFGKNSASPKQNPPTVSLAPLELPQWKPIEFNRDCIRLLVFSDSDDTGLELIFDSKTVRLVSTTENENLITKQSTLTNNARISTSPNSTASSLTGKPPIGPFNGGGTRFRPAVTRFTHKGKQYELLKASNDIRNYADYIFGTMPLVHKGTGMKVHTSKTPLQIMMSRVFAVKLPDKPELIMNTAAVYESEPMSNNLFHSLPGTHGLSSLSSNVSVVSSTISSIDVLGEDLTNQKFGRLYRRWLKCANRTMKQPQRQPGRRYRRCIGVAFIVTFLPSETSKYKHFEEFFCTHAPLIENHFQKIMITAEANLNERNTVAAALLDKLSNFKNDLYTLYTRPRLLSPAWYIFTREDITMARRRLLAQQLCSIIDIFSTSKYGDFLNCVLSAVLTYQLSWLSTVSPSPTKTKQQVLFKTKADYSNALQSFLQYSPLWAQLIDLFSAYGQPPYICRTVLVGTDASLLNRLLYLLSFYIRPSYLTYKMPNTNLSDTNDVQNRTYKKIRLYTDELISNAIQIQDIEPYSPVHSVHEDDDIDDDTDIDVLSIEESSQNNYDIKSFDRPNNHYPFTFKSNGHENMSVNEDDVLELLNGLVIRVEYLLINEQIEIDRSPKKVSTTLQSSLTKTIVNKLPTKTLKSLPLFEPNLAHEKEEIDIDYHLDLALSLMSTSGSSYSSDFILQAIETSNVNEVIQSILTQHAYDMSENGGLFLNGERIDASITVLINLDGLSVNIYSSKNDEKPQKQEHTTLIQPLIQHAHLAKQLLPGDFALLNMEDSLQEIYFQALAILKYIKLETKSVSNQISNSSLGDSPSSTSLTSSDTESKRSRMTSNTVIEMSQTELINSTSTLNPSDSLSVINTSELEQNVIRKFQLKRSDYMFLKNILYVLEMEQMQMIS